MTKPRIAITIGDPAGIGPEIVLKTVSDPEVAEACEPIVVGHEQVLKRCSEAVGIEPAPYDLVHVETPGIESIRPGKLSAEAGRAAEAYIRRACEMGLGGEIDAISTAPINKESLRLAGIRQIGHTEMLAEYLGAPDPLTLFITENMRIFFLSRHLSLRQAIEYITQDRVYEFIRRVNAAMTDLGFASPKIGLAALNPHASDGGQFGDEEEKHLIPATRRAQSEGIDVTNPIGADSVFAMALDGKLDCVISLYHDQGHIAAKTRDFHGTVTATLGLPVLRTSVDHGTAFDIAWQGIANPVSMKRAILAAVEMRSSRRHTD